MAMAKKNASQLILRTVFSFMYVHSILQLFNFFIGKDKGVTLVNHLIPLSRLFTLWKLGYKNLIWSNACEGKEALGSIFFT